MNLNILNVLVTSKCDLKQCAKYYNGKIEISLTENIGISNSKVQSENPGCSVRLRKVLLTRHVESVGWLDTTSSHQIDFVEGR